MADRPRLVARFGLPVLVVTLACGTAVMATESAAGLPMLLADAGQIGEANPELEIDDAVGGGK